MINYKIPAVKYVKSINNQLYIGRSEGIYLFDQNIQDIDLQSLQQRHQAFLYYNQKGDFCILKKKELIVFEQAGFYPNTFDGQSILLRYDTKYHATEDKWRFNVGRFDVKSKLQSQVYEAMNSLGVYDRINTGYLCSENRNKILLFSIETGQCQWKIELDGKEIVQYFAFIENNLYFSYRTASDQAGLMKIDACSGAVIWERTFATFNAVSARFVHRTHTFINLQCGGLWINGARCGNGNNLFMEVEIVTGQIVRQGVLHELDALDLQIKTFEVHQKRIYFTANHQGSFGAIAVGVLSIQTLKLLWWEVVEMEQAGGFGNFLLNSITVAGNQFGILDKTGVLHLYEKKTGFRAPRTRQKGLVPFEALTVEPVPTISPFPMVDTLQKDPVESIPLRSVVETHVNDDLPF